jgi:RHS repeat-associated protein
MMRARHIPLLATLFTAILMPGAAIAADVVTYYHLDAIGNVREVTNQAGQVVERHDYLPFGEECTTGPCATNPGVGAGQPKKFTGKERDNETGLDYFGARYYGSRIARFTTVDPVYTWQENILDPQRWNRYAYGRNNPLRFVDPDGKEVRIQTPQLLAQTLQRNAEIQAAVMGFLGKWDPFPADPIVAGMAMGLVFPTSQKEYDTNLVMSAFDLVAPLEMTGATEIVQRAMSRAEVEATQATGLVRGGEPGPTTLATP